MLFPKSIVNKSFVIMFLIYFKQLFDKSFFHVYLTMKNTNKRPVKISLHLKRLIDAGTFDEIYCVALHHI